MLHLVARLIFILTTSQLLLSSRTCCIFSVPILCSFERAVKKRQNYRLLVIVKFALNLADAVIQTVRRRIFQAKRSNGTDNSGKM